MASIVQRAIKLLSVIENSISRTFYFRFPPEYPVPALVNLPGIHQEKRNPLENLSELLKDSILWAVPKRRRSVERRRCRKFGYPQYFYKMLLPKTNILTCTKCGHYHEAGLLCPNCYSKVKAETEAIQEVIQEKLGISPVENEVVVLYQNESYDPELYKGKRIVEMKKERPPIFSHNLLEKSTQGPAKTKDVIKPNEVS